MSDPIEDLVLAYLARLQAEAQNGFHKRLRAWVDDSSSVAKVLRAFADDPINPPREKESDHENPDHRVP